MHGLWIPDSGCHSPTDFIFSVSGTWSMDSNRKWDSGSVLDLYSGFQSPGFYIPPSNFFHYFGFHKQNFPGIGIPLHGANLKDSHYRDCCAYYRPSARHWIQFLIGLIHCLVSQNDYDWPTN